MDENKLVWYAENLDETLIQGVKAAETIEYNIIVNGGEFEPSWMRERKEL